MISSGQKKEDNDICFGEASKTSNAPFSKSFLQVEQEKASLSRIDLIHDPPTHILHVETVWETTMKKATPEVETLNQLINMPKSSRKKAPKVGVADMTDAEFRAYKAKLQADRRQAIKAKKAQGILPFNTSTTRDALADAALMLLASDGPGADAIRSYLSRVFPAMPGVPFTVTTRAKAGELRPRLLEYAKVSGRSLDV